MESIIKKLNEIKNVKDIYNSWSLEEIKQLLEVYSVISKKETYIFDLIYYYHGCDSYEDIFRDYSERYLEDKADGVEEALNNINEKIQIQPKPIENK
jgi:hypothetical protein